MLYSCTHVATVGVKGLRPNRYVQSDKLQLTSAYATLHQVDRRSTGQTEDDLFGSHAVLGVLQLGA